MALSSAQNHYYFKKCPIDYHGILYVDLVSDDILQVAQGSDLLIKFVGGILHTLLINATLYSLFYLYESYKQFTVISD